MKGEIKVLKEENAGELYGFYGRIVQRAVKKGFMEENYDHSIQEIREWFKARKLTLGYYEKGGLVGTISFDPWFKISAVRIFNVMVTEKSKGLATKLLEEVERWCSKNKKRAIFCFAREKNQLFIRWLEKRGFQKVGESDKIYRGGRRALIYWKEVQGCSPKSVRNKKPSSH